jgi:hypothetical protein
MSVDEYVDAVRRELRDQPRAVRRTETAAVREHLDELPAEARADLGAPRDYAHAYRAGRGLRVYRVRYRWRAIPRAARVLIVAGALVTIVAVAGAIWLAHYRPADAQFEGFGPVQSSRVGVCTTVDFSDVDVCTVRTGDEFFIEGAIANHSRFALDLVGLPRSDYALIEPVVVRGAPCDRAVRTADQCPAQHFPIHVAAHHDALVVIEYRIVGRCIGPATPNAESGFGDPPVDLRVHFVGGDRVVHATFPGGRDRTMFRLDGCSGNEAVPARSHLPR